MSLLRRFAGSAKKTQTETDATARNGAGKGSPPATMTLKLSTPSSPQSEEPTKLLSDILMNEQLFEVFHGKSLILHAEVKVEKQLDGSPKSMIVSGQVPVTLSKGFRNGKPTREIRVRGHLRRKLSSEMTTNTVDLNNADRMGRKQPLNLEAEDKYGPDSKREQYGWRKALKDPPLRPLEQAEFQTSSPYLTYSKLGLSRLEKKNDLSHWSAGEAAYIDQKLPSENNLQENPTGIAHWSPYFDCGSPMSGRQFEASWDLREKTPTPRVSSPSGRGFHVGGEEKSSSRRKSSHKPTRRGDWTPLIGVASSSADSPTIKKNESFGNVRPQKHEGEDPRWDPQVNYKCTLVDGNRSIVGEDQEEGNGKDLDHFGLCVARSESVVDALKQGKLNACCKEDTLSTDSILNYKMSDQHFQDDATQTTRRRTEISKISDQVGRKLSHLKEMVMRPKMNPEHLINVSEADKRDRNGSVPSNIHGKQLDNPAKQVSEEKSEHNDDKEKLPVHFRSPRSAGDKSARVVDKNQKNSDHCYACGSHGQDDFRDKIDQEMLDKLSQARVSSADSCAQITAEAADGEQNRVTSRDPAKAEKAAHSSKKPVSWSKMVQARESSIDQYVHGARNKGDGALQALGDKVKKVVHGIGNESGKLFGHKDKTGRFDKRTESDLAQYESSKDQVTWSDGDHTREKSSDHRKEHLGVRNRSSVYVRDESHHFNSEVVRNSPVQSGGSPTDRSPHTTRPGGHDSEKSGVRVDKIENVRETGDLLQGVYGYAADKLNSRGEDSLGKTENTLSPTRGLQDTKNLNPIVAITISRSRTKFFRYDNGAEYEEKEGAQVVTVEAPQGLFYSSPLRQWSSGLQTTSKE